MKKALEKSIRHWAENVKALEKIQGVEGKFKNAGYSFHFNCSEIVKYGVDDCALCDKYLYSGIKCIACLWYERGLNEQVSKRVSFNVFIVEIEKDL